MNFKRFLMETSEDDFLFQKPENKFIIENITNKIGKNNMTSFEEEALKYLLRSYTKSTPILMILSLITNKRDDKSILKNLLVMYGYTQLTIDFYLETFPVFSYNFISWLKKQNQDMQKNIKDFLFTIDNMEISNTLSVQLVPGMPEINFSIQTLDLPVTNIETTLTPQEVPEGKYIIGFGIEYIENYSEDDINKIKSIIINFIIRNLHKSTKFNWEDEQGKDNYLFEIQIYNIETETDYRPNETLPEDYY